MCSFSSALALGFIIFNLNGLSCKDAGYYEYRYSLKRECLKEKERDFSQTDVKLGKDEKIVDNYLQHLKSEEFQATRDNFPPSRPIEKVLTQIKSSYIYGVLKKFPKGGNVHIHYNSIVSKKKMLDLIFDSPLVDNLCVKTQPGPDKWQLSFFVTPPTGWVKVTSDPVLYSRDQLLQHLTLINVLDDNAKANPTDSSIRWQLMNPLFIRSGGSLIDYANFTRMYMKAMFEAAIEENIQYLEARAEVPKLFVEDGSSSSGQRHIDTEDGDLWITILREEISDFKHTHPEFVGFRYIVNDWRFNTKQRITDSLNRAVRLKEKYPDIIGGFDVTSQEDTGHSLLFYLEAFAEAAANNQNIPLYFHAAETNWPDDLFTSVYPDDPVNAIENLYEAIILGTKRIGHGLGLIKHPYLMQIIKEKKISVSASPVSHMILSAIPDLRNHPALTYFRYGIPIVFGSDGQGTLGVDEFTVDWYEAFMGWGLNLADLKQLAMNSLEYSTMSETEKQVAIKKWNNAYFQFISEMRNEACEASLDFPEPVFYSMYPDEGSLTTTTKVRIYGRNFQSGICQNITCYFDNMASQGSYVYNTLITLQTRTCSNCTVCHFI